MSQTKLSRAAIGAFLCTAAMVLGVGTIQAQTATEASRTSSDVQKQDDANLETELHLILATNRTVEEGKFPSGLEPVVRQLRGSLPFKSYNLASTLLSRVKNGGHLSVSWVRASGMIPTFEEFAIGRVKIIKDELGHNVVSMENFRFGSRVPIQTGQTTAASGNANQTFPVINYEPTGLHTDISIREGEAAVVGTLNVGPSGDAIVVVVSAKKAMP